jgi:hypothetical protein
MAGPDSMGEKSHDLLKDLQKRLGKRSSKTQQVYDDLLYTIHELAQRERLEEDALRELAGKIRRYLESLYDPNLSWQDVDYHEIRDLRDPVMEWKAVKIRALLETMTEPTAVKVGNEKHLATTMTFRDVDTADNIDSIPTVNTSLIRRLESQKWDHPAFDILGTVVLVPIGCGPGERFQIMVHDMRVAESPPQMIRARKGELEQARRTLRELRHRSKSTYGYIMKTLTEGLGIQGLSKAPELMDSLEAVIVQAFSDGWVNNASGKLHTLIIGAPAVGKKLLTEATRCLNPSFQEAHPGKATAAGVCSTAVQRDGLWISKPGYLPLADRGVFAIQDFHAVKDAQREKLLGIFNMVMEDGRVIDSTAARQMHPALTSIHLDTNKRTDLFPDSQLHGDTIIAKRLDDIRIPMTILSRFDFIIDIPRDTERQMEISLAMYDRPSNVQGPRDPAQQQADWSRKLRVLVAFLRAEHAEIRFPEAIRRYMRDKQQAPWKNSPDAMQRVPWLSDFQARLTNSVFKFVAAYSRMNGRNEPIREDVDRAFRIIHRKFEFVATLAQHLNLAKTWEIPEGPNLQQWLLDRFSGKRCATREILRAYEDSFGIPAVRRTIERHLPSVARRMRKGLWEFPAVGSI